VTVEQMTQTLVWAVENPLEEIPILEPPQMRRVFGEGAIPSCEAAWA